MPGMTVGQAASTVGVSPKAIRIWESKGLIPKPARTSTGYRAFTEADLATLRFIRQAKTLGLTLGEIKDVIQLTHAGGCPCDRVMQAVNAHISAIDRSIADLVQLRHTLTRAKDSADLARPNNERTSICQIIENTSNEDRIGGIEPTER